MQYKHVFIQHLVANGKFEEEDDSLVAAKIVTAIRLTSPPLSLRSSPLYLILWVFAIFLGVCWWVFSVGCFGCGYWWWRVFDGGGCLMVVGLVMVVGICNLVMVMDNWQWWWWRVLWW